MAFPTSLTTLPDTTTGEVLGTAGGGIGISAYLDFVGVDLLAIETKIGTGSATPALNKVLVGDGTGTSTWSATLAGLTLTTPVISTISNTGTLTLPTSTDTLVGKATTDTLTNKTLTAPIISTISNTGTLTLPTSTDTLVGKATTDTLTNKTLTAPTISDFTNAAHDHGDADDGGAIVAGAIPAGAITNARLATSAGEIGAAWQTWTPTFVNWTIGTGGSAGTTAAYIQIGKTVHIRIASTLGSSGQSVGAGVTFTLPVAGAAYGESGTSAMAIGVLRFEDTGVTNYIGELQYSSATPTKATVVVRNAAGTYVGTQAISATIPLTFGAGDSFTATGTYEAA